MTTRSDSLDWMKSLMEKAKDMGYTHIPIEIKALDALIEMFQAVEEHMERKDNAITAES